MIITRTITQEFYMVDSVTVSNGNTLPMYGSVEKADNFFYWLIEGQRWTKTVNRDRKIKCLVSATKLIDRLNFVGTKASESQQLQFPRGTDTLVPVDIENACYHLAQSLLKGVEPNTERDNLNTTVQVYSSIRSYYDRNSTPPHIRAGIPDATAWEYLLPYLLERRELEIRRVS